jgi:hypothetical protein
MHLGTQYMWESNQNLDLQTLDLHTHALRHSIHGIKSKHGFTNFEPILMHLGMQYMWN